MNNNKNGGKNDCPSEGAKFEDTRFLPIRRTRCSFRGRCRLPGNKKATLCAIPPHFCSCHSLCSHATLFRAHKRSHRSASQIASSRVTLARLAKPRHLSRSLHLARSYFLSRIPKHLELFEKQIIVIMIAPTANMAAAANEYDFSGDSDVAPAAAVAAKPKKAKGPKKSNQPTMMAMVVAACQNAADSEVGPARRKGISSQAIKKYLYETFGVDTITQASRIRKALVTAVTTGAIMQTKGQGASGSFRVTSLAGAAKPAKKTAPAAKKPKVAKDATDTGKSKKVATKSKAVKDTAAAAKPKKAAAAKKTAPVKKSATPAKAKAAAKAAPAAKAKAKKSSAVEKKASSPKVRKAPKARKSPMVKKAGAAKKK